MDEFTLNAVPRYEGNRRGEAIAEVFGPVLGDCFVEMADKIADWLTDALAGGQGSDVAQAIELTLEWSNAAALQLAQEPPSEPSGAAHCAPHAPRRSVRCIARRSLDRACGAGVATPAALRGAST